MDSRLNTDRNHASYWREFDRTLVTHSAAHYLMAIDRLRSEFGYARATDVAGALEVSRGAVSLALAQLKKRGLVGHDPHRFLLLTENGKQVVGLVKQNFKILSTFFEEVLGAPPEVARADACKMEHLVSLETGWRMLQLMEIVLREPGRAAQLRAKMARSRPRSKRAGKTPRTSHDGVNVAAKSAVRIGKAGAARKGGLDA